MNKILSWFKVRKATEQNVTRYMRRVVNNHIRDMEVQMTPLAEDAAEHFDCDEMLDDPNSVIWECAYAITKEKEEQLSYLF